MADISELLEKKRKLVQDIYLNTQNQVYFLKDGKDEKFIELLEARRVIIDELVKVDEEIKKIGKLPPDLKDLEQEINEKIKKINTIDEKNKEFIAGLQESINERLSYMKKSKRAFVNGYSKAIEPNYSNIIDKKK